MWQVWGWLSVERKASMPSFEPFDQWQDRECEGKTVTYLCYLLKGDEKEDRWKEVWGGCTIKHVETSEWEREWEKDDERSVVRTEWEEMWVSPNGPRKQLSFPLPSLSLFGEREVKPTLSLSHSLSPSQEGSRRTTLQQEWQPAVLSSNPVSNKTGCGTDGRECRIFSLS